MAEFMKAALRVPSPGGQYFVKFLSPFWNSYERSMLGATLDCIKMSGVSYGATVFDGKGRPNDAAAPAQSRPQWNTRPCGP